jgi:hypothetical protein
MLHILTHKLIKTQTRNLNKGLINPSNQNLLKIGNGGKQSNLNSPFNSFASATRHASEMIHVMLGIYAHGCICTT